MNEIQTPGSEMPKIPVSLDLNPKDSKDVESTKLRMRASVDSMRVQGFINTIKAPVDGAKAIEVKTS